MVIPHSLLVKTMRLKVGKKWNERVKRQKRQTSDLL